MIQNYEKLTEIKMMKEKAKIDEDIFKKEMNEKNKCGRKYDEQG